MLELDDPVYLAQHDHRRLLAQTDEWQQQLAAAWPDLDATRVDAPWLQSCRSDVACAANPAKQLALKLYERVPLIWSDAPFAAHARHWQTCISRYAEAAAVSATLEEMVRNWSMARFSAFLEQCRDLRLPDRWQRAPIRARSGTTNASSTADQTNPDNYNRDPWRRRCCQRISCPDTRRMGGIIPGCALPGRSGRAGGVGFS